MNSKERGIRRRYERIEGIVTQIFFSTRKLVTIYWELIRVRGGIVYRIRDQRESEAKEKLALVETYGERDIVILWTSSSSISADVGNREDVPRYPVPYRSSSLFPLFARL